MTTFPPKIKFLTDLNEAKLIEVLPSNGKVPPHGKYQYTKSKTKKDMTFTATLEYLTHLFNNLVLKVGVDK
jgi:hypothetical protein